MSRPRTLTSISSLLSRRVPAIRQFSQLSKRHVLVSRRMIRSNPRPIISSRSYVIATDGTNIENLIDQVSDSQYSRIANDYLETLSDDMEELCEDFPQIDVELTQGVMTLTVADGKTYVINKQPPNKQIWLSSPYSGPKRYDLIGGKWVTLRDNTGLTDLLRQELQEELGQEITLSMQQ
ncbi:hypothetical protein JCM33374_g2820 [Metschnikowia sp. JCM 33374]|nr:hypothetical protein JCM33374_g2820 [Metschnikowia sp. JCM 33374]